MLGIRIISALTAILFFSCTSKMYKASKVETFEYGGYGDSTVSLIEGEIYSNVGSSEKTMVFRPLQGVTIKVEENGKVVTTDSTGRFLIGLEKGTFNLLVRKDGYQQLRILNYVSDPDQVSKTKIFLANGNVEHSYRIPDRKTR